MQVVKQPYKFQSVSTGVFYFEYNIGNGRWAWWPFMCWHWRNKLKWAPFKLFAPSPLLQVRSWLHPFQGHCEQQAMRDEEVIYVAGNPLLYRRCTILPGCTVSEMTYIVSGGALNSTHSLTGLLTCHTSWLIYMLVMWVWTEKYQTYCVTLEGF